MNETDSDAKRTESIKTTLNAIDSKGAKEMLLIFELPPRVRDAALAILLSTQYPYLSNLYTPTEFELDTYEKAEKCFATVLKFMVMDGVDLGGQTEEELNQIFLTINRAQDHFSITFVQNILGSSKYQQAGPS